MKLEKITSRKNPLIMELAALRKEADPDLILLEGPKLVEEALKASLRIETLIIQEGARGWDDSCQLVEGAKQRARRTLFVSESVFRALSDVEEPQGIAAVCRRPRWIWEQILAGKPAPILILDGLQNPGNVAAILRTAEAAGAAGVITTPETAHLFSPKALRGAMGSTLRLPSLEHKTVDEIVTRLKESTYSLLGSGPKGISYLKADWIQAWAVLLGQEGGGISPQWEPHLKQTVSIPMQPPVESLNVGAAAAVLLYEAFRQRTSR